MPRCLPILTSFAGRVAGCGHDELLSSGAVLARALRDAQKVAGHDGVLCLFEPGLLAGCCIGEGGAPRLVEPDAVVAAPAFQVLVDAVGALGAQLPANVSTIFTLAGSALLRRELQARCPDAPELDDWDYVSDVLTAALGAAFDSPARGLALVDSFDGVPDADLTAMYRSARKLADFYERPFVLFLLPGSAPAELPGGPQCTFALPQGIFWLWVFCVGLASAVSHMAITYALAFAPSSTLAPLHYLEIVTAVVLGYLVFGDLPNALTVAGIAIIVASGLYIIHRERVTARTRGLTTELPA